MNKINIMLLQNIKDLVITMNFFYEQKQFEKGDDTQRGIGAPDCVATLVERQSGFAMLGKLRNRTSRGMTQRLRRLVRRAPQSFKTMTADNGTEFHDYRTVETTTGITFYFATPYHSRTRPSG